jgi:hypothetical protein
MNALMPILNQHLEAPERNNQVVSLLDEICHVLEPTEAQYKQAEERYVAVGTWVAEATEGFLRASAIFPQGSFATGTAVRPINQMEFDVDLICHIANPGLAMQPFSLKKSLGDRLLAHGKYRLMLEEKPRCWRLSYANEFHLDITPTIPNEACRNGGHLVPDKAMRCWKETNPQGFRALFDARAKLNPRFRVQKAFAVADSLHRSVEPFPDPAGMSGFLRRIVQLAKRSRDIYFEGQDRSIWPISVILTTLASQSYEWCVSNLYFDDELGLICAVVEKMPHFIQRFHDGRTTSWFIWNETTSGENFAEKWNIYPARAEAFFAWHARFMQDLQKLKSVAGADIIRKSLADSYGAVPVTTVFDAVTAKVSAARQAGSLMVVPGVGLTSGISARTGVRSNTFFGSD